MQLDGDAWTSKRSESVRTDDGSGTSDTQNMERDASWGVAVTEKKEIESREVDRKLQQEKLAEERAKADAENAKALQHMAEIAEAERQAKIAQEEREKEDIARKREEERRSLEQIQQTVNINEQAEALMMLDEI